MDATLTLVDLGGAVALLLWGLHMVQTGVQRAFGAGLRRLLGLALGGRVRAFGCGLLVTGVLQSSTATGLMVSNFAAAGLVGLPPALAAMLGANVGTTLIVQVLSFDVSRVASLALLVGVALFRRGTATRARDLGRVAIGLGLMLMALRMLLGLVSPLEDVPSLRLLLGSVATQPVLAMLVAAAFTWAAHSSVATVLLVASLASKGVVPPEAALAMVLGANLGTAVNPLIEGAAGAGGAGRRLAIGNLVTRLVGIVVVLAVLARLGPWLAARIDDPGQEVALFHVGFNLVVALVFLPVLGPFARGLERVLPGAPAAADPGVPAFLDPAEGDVPAVALAGAAREALRMADLLGGLVTATGAALGQEDRRRAAEMRAGHAVLERLGGAVRSFVLGLEEDAMSDADRERAGAVLAFASNVEAAGEVLAGAVAGLSAARVKRGVALPGPARAELAAAAERLGANVRRGAAVLLSADGAAARGLVAEKEAFRLLEGRTARAEMDGLRAGDAAAATAVLELVRALKRANAHLVAGAAYPVLEAEGALLSTRVRDEE